RHDCPHRAVAVRRPPHERSPGDAHDLDQPQQPDPSGGHTDATRRPAGPPRGAAGSRAHPVRKAETTMTTLDRFAKLGIENAPGQQQTRDAVPVLMDFSHGDVDAFPPPPGTVEAFTAAFRAGAGRAYSPYRGHGDLLESTAAKIAGFTGAPVDPGDGLMITPGTQAGLFLALAALVEAGDKVVIVEPDYFANRKIVNFLGGRNPARTPGLHRSVAAGPDRSGPARRGRSPWRRGAGPVEPEQPDRRGLLRRPPRRVHRHRGEVRDVRRR